MALLGLCKMDLNDEGLQAGRISLYATAPVQVEGLKYSNSSGREKRKQNEERLKDW